MILTFYDRSYDVTKQATDEEKSRFDRILEIVKNELTQLRNASVTSGDATSRHKFVDCLFNVSRHYPKIVSHFANGFIYNLKNAQLVSSISQANISFKILFLTFSLNSNFSVVVNYISLKLFCRSLTES